MLVFDYHEIHEDHEEFHNLIISATGFQIPWPIKGKSYRFSPLWSNGPQLHGGTPIGKVPAASHGIIIKSYTSGRAGGLICEPLKGVWPAYAGIYIHVYTVFLPLPTRERIEVRVNPMILFPYPNPLPQREGISLPQKSNSASPQQSWGFTFD